MLEVHMFPCLSDNYGFLLHDTDSKETVAIDTPDATAYLREAKAKGWNITQIWNTHWHPDHSGGNAAIKAATNCTITASATDAPKIDAVDRTVEHGDTVTIGNIRGNVIDVGGHTLGHIAYFLPEARIAFVGDALFALGCGRMFEGTAQQFWASLKRIRNLPDSTQIYCAHEYTKSNLVFALHKDPDNEELKKYADDIIAALNKGKPTVPALLGRERLTNPFLRADDPAFATSLGISNDPVKAFATLRAEKDNFRG